MVTYRIERHNKAMKVVDLFREYMVCQGGEAHTCSCLGLCLFFSPAHKLLLESLSMRVTQDAGFWAEDPEEVV